VTDASAVRLPKNRGPSIPETETPTSESASGSF
jgi:hypothetical protein